MASPFQPAGVRDVEPRLGPASAKDIEYPMGYYTTEGYGNGKYTIRNVVSQPVPDLGDFPANIAKYLWTHEGGNDAENWYALFRLKDGRYGFLEASCCASGFGCKGDMYVYAGTLAEMVTYAMSDEAYRLYEAATVRPRASTRLALAPK